MFYLAALMFKILFCLFVQKYHLLVLLSNLGSLGGAFLLSPFFSWDLNQSLPPLSHPLPLPLPPPPLSVCVRPCISCRCISPSPSLYLVNHSILSDLTLPLETSSDPGLWQRSPALGVLYSSPQPYSLDVLSEDRAPEVAVWFPGWPSLEM